MPIHIICGKPGSGKSLYAVTRVVTELLEGTRNVVTNLPIHVGRLNEYLQAKYPDVDCRLTQRLRLLSEDDLREFWKIRGPEPVEGAPGVAYFLDEAHIAFNAREWATLGKGALHYLSQHRKLGDVVWPITQAPGNLDKQFRSVAEDFTLLRNEYTAKYGVFKGRGRFVRRTYLSEPTGNAEPFETATFQLDAEGIASCYDTAKGIGVHGNKADIGRRAKGISIWWIAPAAALLAVGCVALPWLLGRALQGRVEKKLQTALPAKAAPVTAAIAGETKTVPTGPLGARVEKEPPVYAKKRTLADAVEAPAVVVDGAVFGAAGARVWLSDGRVLVSGDGLLRSISAAGVEMADGSRIPFRKPVNAKGTSNAKPLALVGLPSQTVRGSEPEAKTSSGGYRGEAMFPANPDVAKLPGVDRQPSGQAPLGAVRRR